MFQQDRAWAPGSGGLNRMAQSQGYGLSGTYSNQPMEQAYSGLGEIREDDVEGNGEGN